MFITVNGIGFKPYSSCHTKLVKNLRAIIKLTNQLRVTVLKTALRPLVLVKLEEFFEVT